MLCTVMRCGLCVSFLNNVGAEATLNRGSRNIVIAECVTIGGVIDNVTGDSTQLDAVTLPKDVGKLLLALARESVIFEDDTSSSEVRFCISLAALIRRA